MVNSKYVYLVWGIIVLIITSCNNDIYTIEKYYAYMNNPENGVVKYRAVESLEFSLKYLPVDYLIYKSKKTKVGDNLDSLKNENKDKFHFLLKIAPSKKVKQEFDVMTETVSTELEYKQQALLLNFNLQEYLTLKVGEVELKPVLVETENVYGLTKHRLINLVFARENLTIDFFNEPEIDIVFQDAIYNTGFHHFIFNTTDLKNIPSLKIN